MNTPNDEPLGAPASVLGWLIWCVLFAMWTAALLTPDPILAGQSVLPEAVLFLSAKLLHVTAYAVLGWLGSWLPKKGRIRAGVLILLIAHTVATEFLQTLVPHRTGCWRDVALDLFGIGIGMTLYWRCRHYPRSKTSADAP